MPTPPPSDPTSPPTSSTLYELGRESAETKQKINDLMAWRLSVVDPFIETMRDMREDVKALVSERDEQKADRRALRTDVRTAILGALGALAAKGIAPEQYQSLVNWLIVGSIVVIVVLFTSRRS